MRFRRAAVGLASVVAFFLLAEVAVRLVGSELLGVQAGEIVKLRMHVAGVSPSYEPHPYVGYVMRNESPGDPTRPTDWSIDISKQPGVLRIACLGGSTTWGGYPLNLEQRLEELSGQDVQVMNWGVAGWSTAETLVNYFLNVQDYDPDVIVLHHSLNDMRARRAKGFRSDYGHWRQPWGRPDVGALSAFLIRSSDLYALLKIKAGFEPRLEDFVPQTNIEESSLTLEDLPAGSEKSFERNVRSVCLHARGRGARVVLVTMPYNPENATVAGELELWAAGMEQHNQILRNLCAEEGFDLVDLERKLKTLPDGGTGYFLDRVHLTQKGGVLKAQAIAKALIDAGCLAGSR